MVIGDYFFVSLLESRWLVSDECHRANGMSFAGDQPAMGCTVRGLSNVAVVSEG